MLPIGFAGHGGSPPPPSEKDKKNDTCGTHIMTILEYRNFLIECSLEDQELSFLPKQDLYMFVTDFGMKYTLWYLPNLNIRK